MTPRVTTPRLVSDPGLVVSVLVLYPFGGWGLFWLSCRMFRFALRPRGLVDVEFGLCRLGLGALVLRFDCGIHGAFAVTLRVRRRDLEYVSYSRFRFCFRCLCVVLLSRVRVYLSGSCC